VSAGNIKRTTRKLVLMSVAMFGFGYALVPLYNVFCEVTGINGKTGTISSVEAEQMTVDDNRLVTVSFDTNIREMPWEFEALERKISVHPGQLNEATFVVRNKSEREIVGRAVPSVAPTQASIYFNKTECFCFTEQTLAAGEPREIKVRFIVDSKMPTRFSTLTLSYTFFAIPEANSVVKVAEQKERTKI
jgi:cytochrome c oxidase assembly protein subunit 11